MGASQTSARKGIPRSAATVLARRKMASGISNVVFNPCANICRPYYRAWPISNYSAYPT